MSDGPFHRLNTWIGIVGGVLSIVIFFSAKPYFKDWFGSKSKRTESVYEKEKQQSTFPDKERSKSTAVSEIEPEGIRNKIISLMEQYYDVNNAEDCYKLANFFSPVVENYYGRANRSRDDIIKECSVYHSRWPYQRLSINNSSVVINPLTGGGYFATYKIFYQIKKNIEDDWLDHDLQIQVYLTTDLKIRAINETKTQG